MPATTEGSITTLQHAASGASCRIHSHGATVLSFVSSDGRENLFLSSKAKLDGSKPIRGGIPVVFPVFGPSNKHPHEQSTMPQHGFARISTWTLASSYDREDSAGATYTLALRDVSPESRGEHNPWSVEQARVDGTDCALTYEIRINANHLTTALVVKNTGTDAFDFQCLLHTYLRVDGNGTKPTVHGLGGYAITDKVTGDSGHVQSYDDDVALASGGRSETDRVYIHPDDHPTIHAFVDVGAADNKKIRVESGGMVDESADPVSCVVWNPGSGSSAKAAAMPDFDAAGGEASQMICVEPGLIGRQPLLKPGAEARLTQTLALALVSK